AEFCCPFLLFARAVRPAGPAAGAARSVVAATEIAAVAVAEGTSIVVAAAEVAPVVVPAAAQVASAEIASEVLAAVAQVAKIAPAIFASAAEVAVAAIAEITSAIHAAERGEPTLLIVVEALVERIGSLGELLQRHAGFGHRGAAAAQPLGRIDVRSLRIALL